MGVTKLAALTQPVTKLITTEVTSVTTSSVSHAMRSAMAMLIAWTSLMRNSVHATRRTNSNVLPVSVLTCMRDVTGTSFVKMAATR